jgi:transposase-like protein
MPRKRFTNEQIAFALRQAENGATVDEVCRKMGVSEPTGYRWKNFDAPSLRQPSCHMTSPHRFGPA